MTTLSVLDTAPVVAGSTARRALQQAVDLAGLADELGYHRYWVAEHHGMPGVASSAPAVLTGRIAAGTGRIRVGAGGVLLPNHAPIVVAEQFGTLEALHPGRIDLALGRAGGGAQRAVGLVRLDADRSDDGFRTQVGELAGYFDPDGRGSVRVVAAAGHRPDLWVLGSGPDSAVLTGGLGLPYAFAAHLDRYPAAGAVGAYRSAFVPRDGGDCARVAVSVTVVAAESDARAARLAGSIRLRLLLRSRGERIPLPAPDDAAAYPVDAADLAEMDRLTAPHVVGGPDTVRERLRSLAEATGADELVVTSPIHAHRDRRRSYEVLADAWG